MKNQKSLWLILVTILITAFTFNVQANGNSHHKPYKEFGNTKVYYSTFNSDFILPEVARTYNIVRGKDKGLVNISVIVDDKVGGKIALVKGRVFNILGQQQQLDFFEVNEGNTVYYLAPFEFDNEESMTFKIEVKPDPNKPAHSLSFQNKFYINK